MTTTPAAGPILDPEQLLALARQQGHLAGATGYQPGAHLPAAVRPDAQPAPARSSWARAAAVGAGIGAGATAMVVGADLVHSAAGMLGSAASIAGAAAAIIRPSSVVDPLSDITEGIING